MGTFDIHKWQRKYVVEPYVKHLVKEEDNPFDQTNRQVELFQRAISGMKREDIIIILMQIVKGEVTVDDMLANIVSANPQVS